jgi:hypothetical protein
MPIRDLDALRYPHRITVHGLDAFYDRPDSRERISLGNIGGV